jgi:L-lactate dehydrogenase complex protein LldG
VGIAAEGEAMSEARDQILARIRHATSGDRRSKSYPQLPRDYIHLGVRDKRECAELMIERLREYDAEVLECGPGDLAACIAACLHSSGRRIFVAPSGLPDDWRAPGFSWKIDNNLSHAAIEASDGVVTACFAAVADSGTIVLHHSPAEGRRIISLLPDWHLCILRVGQIVETLPEYFALCTRMPTLATYISGPSATADIEMTRIKGVHGPRFLHVIVVHDEA